MRIVLSFPDISRHFNISYTLTYITIAINFLGFCISSIIYGPLSDSFGRRKIMLYGNAIMMFGAIGCVVANNIQWLIFVKLLQGIGASTSAVIVFVIISETYSSIESAKIISIINSLLTVFVSIAPMVGNVINQTLGGGG